jgi:hypothetical protein
VVFQYISVNHNTVFGNLVSWFCGCMVSGMTYELSYWPAADEALGRLESDPAMAPVVQAVNRTLRKLEADPFGPRLGTTAFMTEALGGISATPVGLDDWYILWQRGVEQGVIEIVLIHRLPV